ncbi:MAG: hypothetical protein H0U75_00440 [Legionella sp.]|nr:hypothetical protein [Legionella sp.]
MDKFKTDCNNFCSYELITDKTRLLPFQFQRPTSPYTFSKVWMRPACNEFYSDLFPSGDAKFIADSGYFFRQYFTITQGKAVASDTFGANGYLNQILNPSVGKKCVVKVITSDIATGNPYTAQLRHNGSILGNIATAGVHLFTFTATGVDDIKIHTVLTGTDTIKFEEFSAYQINDYSLANGDVLLNIDLEYKNVGANDLISYCGSAFENTLVCGAYYLIFYSNDGVYLFSEIFHVKNFVPEASPYVLIEWSNTCDLQNVKYTGLDCNYINRLYIDGPVTKPEYPFNQKVEEDGNQVSHIIFQKWEKSRDIIIPKAPEFLVDALTAMRLHDDIKFYERLRQKQHEITEYIEVENLEYDVNYIFSDCAANVVLKALLKYRVIDSTCCNLIEVICTECNYTISDINVYIEDYGVALTNDGGTLQLYILTNGNWVVTVVPSGTIVCLAEVLEYYYFNGASWIHTPVLTSLVDNGSSFTVTGNFLPNTYVELTISYGGTTIVYPVIYTAAQLLLGVIITYASVPIVPECKTMFVSALNYTLGCENGISNTLSKTWTAEGCPPEG